MTDYLTMALSVLALIVSAITLWTSVGVVKKREAAERELVRNLMRIYKKKAGRNFKATFPTPSPEQLKELESLLISSVDELNSEYRSFVVKAIAQPSDAGRKAYRQKLIREVLKAAI